MRTLCSCSQTLFPAAVSPSPAVRSSRAALYSSQGRGGGVPCNSSGDPHSERLLRGQEGLRVTWSHPRLIPQVNLGWWSSSSTLGLRLVPCALEVVLSHLLGTVLGSDLMEEQVPYDLIVNMAGPSRAA